MRHNSSLRSLYETGLTMSPFGIDGPGFGWTDSSEAPPGLTRQALPAFPLTGTQPNLSPLLLLMGMADLQTAAGCC